MGVFTTVILPTKEFVQFKHGEDWCAYAKLGEVYQSDWPGDGIYLGISGDMRNGWRDWIVVCRGHAVIACEPFDYCAGYEDDATPERIAASNAAIAKAEEMYGLNWMD